MEEENKTENTSPKSSKRRDIIKGLTTLPVLGLIGWGAFRQSQKPVAPKTNQLEEFKFNINRSVGDGGGNSDTLRLGIIGYGIRGEQLVRGSGFATPEWKAKMKENAPSRLEGFESQEKLNIVYNGVCDIFDVHAESAISAVGSQAKRYNTYQELLASDDIDAVIIATPDHWHSRMVIEAANAGKHIYSEKCLTRTFDEVIPLVEAIKQNNTVFQLGHQLRQTESYAYAQEIIQKGLLGDISLVQLHTNRNDKNGAWVYDIHEKASPESIDWKQFNLPDSDIPFDKDRFFRWRKYWDYGTGLCGDLLTHDFDGLNQIMDLGIPASIMASGGIYHWKDGREVPDVLQIIMEYPERELTVSYSATLASDKRRPNVIMGSDASMRIGSQLEVMADRHSKKYKDQIDAGLIDINKPLYEYAPGKQSVDGITSATAKYFAEKGMLYTYQNGRRVDPTHLHIKEWLDCVRSGGLPSCNVVQAFEEAVTAHMATMSLREGKKTVWNKEAHTIDFA